MLNFDKIMLMSFKKRSFLIKYQFSDQGRSSNQNRGSQIEGEPEEGRATWRGPEKGGNAQVRIIFLGNKF